MAQASTVQREPSMEEILASIRRIIEDSDPARKPDTPEARFDAGQPPPAAKAEVETFRAELGPVAGAPAERRPMPLAAQAGAAPVRSPEPTQVSEFQPKPFRLAEVQAQAAREAAAQPKVAEPERKAVTLADVQQQLAKDAASARPPAALAPAAARPVPQPAPAQPLVETKFERPAPQPVAERQAEPVPADWKSSQPAPKPNPLATSLDAVAKPIISPLASRQVAAAFGELSEAFASRSKKTFDEMAEQMLRPMLQDWLDNNLPVLVERLVREEIERVARGV